MDELYLSVLFSTGETDQNSFLVTDIWIEGVQWTKKGLSLTNQMVNDLKNI